MTKRKFYKTTITVTVLSENPYHADNLEEVAFSITEGDCSGEWDQKSITINGKTAAKELKKQGSDPEFFNLDDKGNELYDYAKDEETEE